MVKKNLKKAKKSWVRIVGTGHFGNSELGESYVYSPEDLIGKRLKVNLSTLIGDMRKQHVNIGFKITEAKGNQVMADFDYYEIVNSHIRRMIRTLKDKIDDSFTAECKDKIKIRVKPVAVTKAKTSNSALTSVRNRIRERFSKSCSESNFNEFIETILNGSYQSELRRELNKIYPLTMFEIRRLEIVK